MSILIFYTINHQNFKCDYTNRLATLNYKKGHVDAFNRMYIQIISSSYTSNIITPKIIKPKLKLLLGDKLIRLGRKLGADTQIHTKRKNNWHMWHK